MAEEAFQKALQVDPNFYDPYIYIAQIKIDEGNFEGAISFLKNSREIDFSRPESYIVESLAYYYIKDDLPKAMDLLDLAIKVQPGSWQAYSARGEIEAEHKDWSAAICDLDAAISRNPTNYDPYYTRAQLNRTLGDDHKALEDIDRAIAMAPRLAVLRLVKGLIFFLISNSPEKQEKRLLRRSISTPKYGDAYFYRARASVRLGDTGNARADLAKWQDIRSSQDTN